MSTVGYEIEPHEIRALMGSALGDELAEPDPLRRYHALTRAQALYDALVSEIKRERGRVLLDLREGRSAQEVADLTGLGTRQRVDQLTAAAR